MIPANAHPGQEATALAVPGIPSGPHMTALDNLLAQSPLPPLTGAEGVAERLVLLVHRGVDWEVWGGTRRIRYWDALTDRVRAATYAGPALSHWWQEIATQISSAPRTAADRNNLAVLIASPLQRDTLTALTEHAATLVLRVRVLSETRAEAREAATASHDTAPTGTPNASLGERALQ